MHPDSMRTDVRNAIGAGVELYQETMERLHRAEAELADEQQAHAATLQRAVRAEAALARTGATPLTIIARGDSPSFEEFARDSAWQALQAFQHARANMQGWPDDSYEVEAALTRIHAMALRFIAQQSQPASSLSKTG